MSGQCIVERAEDYICSCAKFLTENKINHIELKTGMSSHLTTIRRLATEAT